jgi:cytochrome c
MLSRRNRFTVVGVAALALLVAGASGLAEYRHEEFKLEKKAQAITGGSVARGKLAFAHYGCGGCHSIKGVPQASGKVGPPLTGVGARAMIAGKLENRPDNLRRWIEHPQAVSPGTAMPELGVTHADSRDIAAFLYTST